jgi:hypothetical protein
MSDVWYYAEDQKTVGPLTLAELTAILCRVSNPMDVLVWQNGASGWEKAQNVKELAAYLISPQPLPILDANLNTRLIEELHLGSDLAHQARIKKALMKAENPRPARRRWALFFWIGLSLIFTIEIMLIVFSEQELGPQKAAACREDIKCSMEKYAYDAYPPCQKEIERYAKYVVKWVGAPFSYARWADKEKGILGYYGDNVQLQNGFGAWTWYHYRCDFDPSTKTVIKVQVEQGKLKD